MMNPRISTSMQYQQSVLAMQAKQVRIDYLGNQLATGQRMLTAKDDPVGASVAQEFDRNLAALDQYGKNANLVQSRLGMQENTLEEAGNVMARARELVIQANSGVRTLEDRQIIAAELKELKGALLQLANSSDGFGRYLFAGTSDAQVPFVESGGVVNYQGDQTRRQVEIAPDTFVKDAVPGSEVFFGIGPNQQDTFAILDQLINALEQPVNTPADQAALNAALDAGLRDVTLAGEQLTATRTNIGMQLAQIDTAAELRAANTVTVMTSLSEIRDLDYAQAIADFNLEKVALQASQSVFMQMQSMSLFDRMR